MTACQQLTALALIVTISMWSTSPSTVKGDDTCKGYSKPDPESCPCTINCFRYDPVCGANGVTYGCGCPDAACAGVRVVKLGPC
ncbi:hypothetical protein LINPERPRIM_LOCUS27755 [Linum perenne]